MKVYPLFNEKNEEAIKNIIDLINDSPTVEPVCSLNESLKWAIQYLQASLSGPDEIWCYYNSQDSIYYLLNQFQNSKILKASESICDLKKD